MYSREIFRQYAPLVFGKQLTHRGRTRDDWWEIQGHAGSMRTTGVGGPITGKGADLLIIDDPIKLPSEANSQTFRDAQWEWFTAAAYTRLEPGGCILLIMTRWNEDDLGGRVLKLDDEPWTTLHLPAVSLTETDEDYFPDPIGRAPGEALWPWRYPKSVLRKIQTTLGEYWWSALYQGFPTPAQGGWFRRRWFTGDNAKRDPSNPGAWLGDRVVYAQQLPGDLQRCRGYDDAATVGGGDFSAAGLVSHSASQRLWYLEDMVRGQWSSAVRDAHFRATAQSDHDMRGDVLHYAQREPGASGIDRERAFYDLLDGFEVEVDPPTGDKMVRADGMRTLAELGQFRLVHGAWNNDGLSELVRFPVEPDDQVDVWSWATNRLARGPSGGVAGDI
jgi:phage terminase large subunit-like protein